MVTPLTAAEIEDEGGVEDLGEIPFPDEPGGASPRNLQPEPEPEPSGPDGDGPGHIRKDWRKHQVRVGPTQQGRARAPRITNTIRADIKAKISMPLEIGGQIWAARDPLCGGRFLDQRDPIAEAFTDIVCDSADLVAFFTGPGGAFMKYLNLGAAVWPVAEMVAAHHVYHTIALEPAQDGPGSPEARYAA